MEEIAIWECWVASKPDDVTTLIDIGRCVPPRRAKISEIGHPVPGPKHSMLSRVASYCLIANSRDANHLNLLIYRGGCARCISRDQRKFPDVIGSRTVDYWTKLQNLRRDTGGIVTVILCPTAN